LTRPLAVRERQPLEQEQRPLAPARQGRQDLAELVLGAIAMAKAQQAVGQQEADLEKGRVEIEGSPVGGDRIVGTSAEVVTTLASGRERTLLLFEGLPFPDRERAQRRCRQVLKGR
jgi:hypothetical protein